MKIQKDNIEKAFKALIAIAQLALSKFKVSNQPTPLPPDKSQPISNETLVEKIEPQTLVLPPQPANKKFLICPIKSNDRKGDPLTAYTAEMSAVMDHSGTPLDPNFEGTKWYQDNNEVKAFNGEVGNFKKFSEERHAGFSQNSGLPFLVNTKINYVGVRSQGGNKYLQYDGHCGYDYPYSSGTELIAPADGLLYKASEDPINGISGFPTSWEKWHAFYIDHQNGFSTWFLHCEKLRDDIEIQIKNDYKKSFIVNKGQLIAFIGGFGFGKQNGIAIHLHFEVRDKNGNIIDPYADDLWEV